MTDKEMIRKMQETFGYTDEQLLAEYERAEAELEAEKKDGQEE